MIDLDPLVPLGFCAPEFCDLFTDSLYWGERSSSPYSRGELEDSRAVILLRRSTAERLRTAQQYLPGGMALWVVDGFRSTALQRSLRHRVEAQMRLTAASMPAAAVAADADRYVSRPTPAGGPPSPHLTGGAVDLSLMHLAEELAAPLRTGECRGWTSIRRRNHAAQCAAAGVAVDMGCPLDTTSPLAGNALLPRLSEEQRMARRHLALAMTAAGMHPHPYEWWHWEAPGLRNSGATGMPAASPTHDDDALEARRRRMRLPRTCGLATAARLGPPRGVPSIRVPAGR